MSILMIFSIADFVDLMSNKLGLDDEGTEPDWMVWNFTYSQVEPLGWPTALLKKLTDIPVPSRDVTYQTLPGRE
jgi:hypothetical protein